MVLLHELSLVCVVLCLALTTGQFVRESHTSNGRSPMANSDFEALHHAFQGNTEDFLMLTPSTPAPHNVNCYVHVPSTIRIGGRCVRMGTPRGRFSNFRSSWACQAGFHLAFSSDCVRRGRRG